MVKKSEVRKYQKKWEREKRKGTVIGPRFFDGELAKIDARAEAEGKSRAAFVRDIVLKEIGE